MYTSIIIQESNLDFLNCFSLFVVSDFRKFVDMRDLYFFAVYVILTKQTSSQTTLCSSNIRSGNDSLSFESSLKNAMQACIQNIDQCAKQRFALPSSTPTPEVLTSDFTKPTMSQATSPPSKANDKK